MRPNRFTNDHFDNCHCIIFIHTFTTDLFNRFTIKLIKIMSTTIFPCALDNRRFIILIYTDKYIKLTGRHISFIYFLFVLFNFCCLQKWLDIPNIQLNREETRESPAFILNIIHNFVKGFFSLFF